MSSSSSVSCLRSSSLPPHYPPMDTTPAPVESIQKGPMAVLGLIIKCFSPSVGRRVPPNEYKTTHLRLITIGASHYCEKARWGLDLLEADSSRSVYYTEDPHCPPFHSFQTLAASAKPKTSRKGAGGKGEDASSGSNNVCDVSATPMIVYEDGSFLHTSDAILRRHCPWLYPSAIADRVMALEDDLNVRIGASVRCIIYYLALEQRPCYQPALVKVLTQHIPTIEKWLLQLLFEKRIASEMKRLLQINAETYTASVSVLQETFAELSETLLLNGRRDVDDCDERQKVYLCDQIYKEGFQEEAKSYGFTSADLTLAALAAPLLQPDAYIASWSSTTSTPKDEKNDEHCWPPPELQSLCDELRSTRAGQHVLDMYQYHRPLRNGKVVVKGKAFV